jgi:hypothetical protein
VPPLNLPSEAYRRRDASPITNATFGPPGNGTTCARYLCYCRTAVAPSPPREAHYHRCPRLYTTSGTPSSPERPWVAGPPFHDSGYSSMSEVARLCTRPAWSAASANRRAPSTGHSSPVAASGVPRGREAGIGRPSLDHAATRRVSPIVTPRRDRRRGARVDPPTPATVGSLASARAPRQRRLYCGPHRR